MPFDIHRAHYPNDPLNKVGFWGPSTSTLDWCEENYIVSHYFAEFWNTISNLNYILLAVLGIWSCYKINAERRDYIANLGMGTIGVGSWLFHMTLQYPTQLSDELPMIYGSACLVYNFLNLFPDTKYSTTSAVFLACYAIGTTVVYEVTRIPIFFQVAYSILATTVIILSFVQFPRLKKQQQFSSEQLNKLMLVSVGAYLFGFLLWSIDNNYCDQVRDFRLSMPNTIGFLGQFHAWWHLFTGLGGYGSVVISTYMRQIALGRKDVTLSYFWIYPYVSLQKIKKA